MSANVERQYTTVAITAHREPDHRSRTEYFEIHTRDIGQRIFVTVVWSNFHHHFRSGTTLADQALTITKQMLCEALDDAVEERGGMTIAAFNGCFRAVIERYGYALWDGKTIETEESRE